MSTVKILTNCLEKWGIDFEVFNEITGEPTDIMIEYGVKAYNEAECDFCIAIDGGSTLDSGKAIAVMTKLEGSICDYMGKTIEGDFSPLVLILTTAGTGSEATKFTLIADSKKNIKSVVNKMAQDAMDSGSLSNTIKDVTKQDTEYIQ